MSAFICSKEHIDAIINYITTSGKHGMRINVYARLIGVKDRVWSEVETDQQATMLGQFFVDANNESVNFRYDEKDDAFKYTFKRQAQVVSTVQFIKALHCLDYQCCETDDYHKSDCSKLIDKLISDAASRLPGYDDAKWSIG